MIKKNDSILFQGDSITDMRRSRGNNISHSLGHGYVYIIASYLALKHYDKNLTFYNSGIASDKIEDMEKRWQKDTIDLKTNLVSILSGINNVGSIINNPGTTNLDSFKDSYTRIIEQLKKELPSTSIIICEPFTFPVGNRAKNWPKRKQTLYDIYDILKELSYKTNSKYIELQSVFENASNLRPYEYWLYDGVHPSPAGHALIAKTWLKNVMDIDL